MKHLYSSLLLLLFSSGNSINAQTILNGRIVDSSTAKVIEYAWILNYSAQRQIYSNSNGQFRIEAQPGDTLVIYAAGYFYQKVIIDQTMLKEKPFSIQMVIQPVMLTEARIPVIGSYDEFLRKFVNLNKPQTETEEVNEYMAGLSKNAASEGYKEYLEKLRSEGVMIATVPIYTPEERERIKLAEIVEKEQVQDQVYQKFNPHIVRKVTGIESDDEIIEFMVFCKFPDAYILETNDYDLEARIALKYELFLKMKKDKKSMENPLNQAEILLNTLA